jgi:hypothetical protein
MASPNFKIGPKNGLHPLGVKKNILSIILYSLIVYKQREINLQSLKPTKRLVVATLFTIKPPNLSNSICTIMIDCSFKIYYYYR